MAYTIVTGTATIAINTMFYSISTVYTNMLLMLAFYYYFWWFLFDVFSKNPLTVILPESLVLSGFFCFH